MVRAARAALARTLRRAANRVDPSLSDYQRSAFAIHIGDPDRAAKAMERLAQKRRVSGFGR